MRPLFLAFLATGLLLWAGCLNNGTQEEIVAEPRGGMSMYPLSNQGVDGQTAAPDPGAPIGQPVYQDPVFADTVTYSTPGGTVPPLPPPQAISGPVVTYAPAPQEPIPPTRADGKPMTFAERRMARGSPYDPILRGTPYPAYSDAPVSVQPFPASAYVQPALVYGPPTTTTAPVAQPYQQQQYQYMPQATGPGVTTMQGNTVILPDPPMVIRDSSGRVETVGMSTRTTLPLVRVPPQYAPGASGTMVAAAPPVTYQIPPPPVSPNATYAASELQLVPATDVPPGNHPNDAAPSRWYEIIRPGNGPIRIGRVSSTCVCVSLRVPNRFVAAGERALIEARIVSRPQTNGLTYGIYVGVLEPASAMLDADITLRLR